ncbi:MAG TPA: PD-(D/E)XK nuclease family protein [Anaeromyxobacteraceae bacterium]|nr:PD-(D/E)XK nuclease family protein [Anaeromyxobacteraceae bacterium]
MRAASRELVNEFSWSKSRHEKLVECPRAYYYHYYGSWGGWDAAAGASTRELYVLKKLSSRWQWAGSVVHEALRHLLNRARVSGDRKSLEDLVAQTHRRSRAIWAASREKSYWREPSKIEGLVEHEYGEAVPSEEWKRLWDEVIEGSIRSFYASDTFDRIRATPAERWLTVDELDSWAFEGTKIWVAIDFAYRDERGRVHVLDWKTGRERGVDHLQVAIYARYAREKWGVPADDVVGGLVYLGAGAERVDVAVDEAALTASGDKMRESIASMKALLEDERQNVARIGRFPQVEDRDACRRCPFRRPCGRM